MKPSSIFQVKCPYCNAVAEFDGVKDARCEGRGKGYRYACRDCGAYIAAEGATQKPIGSMADKRLRVWRHETTRLITAIVNKNYLTRHQIYQWLQNELELSPQNCKVYHFDIHTCQEVVRVLHDYLNNKNQKVGHHLEKLMGD